MIKSWKNQITSHSSRRNLAKRVIQILTPRVAASLPEGWQRVDSIGKALEWIKERDAESDVFSTINNGDTIGFLILTEVNILGNTELRLGYLLSDRFWGQGLGSELIQGLVKWCVEDGSISAISGGVAESNIASRRILEKSGFTASELCRSQPDMIHMEKRILPLQTEES
jgi:RimJ/RimL family protein N-acetyltransferase